MVPTTVFTVACPSSISATITTSDMIFAFSPNPVTITHGDIIKFVMSPLHAVESSDLDTEGLDGRWDPGIHVPYGATACLQFTDIGKFRFHCPSHNFRGTVVVQ